MNDVAIRVENLSKQYRIGRRESYQTLRDSFTEACTAPFRRLRSLFRGSAGPGESNSQELFWALQDVSFEVKRGEVVGIIGRNGAGKSTLLKILSRITEPTKGYIEIKGRIASLLEVGTGFHQELTGRENIYLNGAILGMRKAEIDRKFDEIVAFSEVEKFIDTPVKFYSSGMYVRLAFAVAAHLEPEILLVDEVLAVGDAAFQKKCLGKMGEVAKEGRTVLFVSHNMGAVRQLCHRAIYIAKGSIYADDYVDRVVSSYLYSNVSGEYNAGLSFFAEPSAHLIMQILSARVKSAHEKPLAVFDVFDPILIELKLEVRRPATDYSIYCEVLRNGEVLFVSFDTSESPELLETRSPGRYKTQFDIPVPLLKPGHYSINLCVGSVGSPPSQSLEGCLRFEVDLLSRSPRYASYAKNRQGVIAVPLKWRSELLPEEYQYQKEKS